ncbi:MAG: peptidylprolyl isomerase, partial [Planctomycetaceae bacterium]|nr:peptidylprolyl isomerase [Planctomycetaceae bacterium]
RPEHPLALNVGGVGHFANHNFEKSLELFETAKQHGVLYPQLGGQYLESARNYIDYWKTEQEIRRKEAAATGDQQLPRVLMKTDQGDILLELFENEAPNTVANFVSLVESGYYDGIPFHRVLPGFMAQGGMQPDPSKAVDYTIKCECYQDNARRHFTGSLSMAKTQQPDSGSTQFFLTHLPTPHLDKEIAPESVHTVFGRVVEGMDAVAALGQGDKILSATIVRKRNHEYQPVTQPGL